MAIRKRGDGWQVDVQVGGRRARQTVSTKALAVELERKIREEGERGKHGLRPGYTLEDALAEHLTTSATALRSLDSLLYVAKAIRPHLNRPIERIAEAAAAIIREGNAAGRKPATINRHLALLRRIGNLALVWGWTDTPVGKRVQLLTENNERHLYLSQEQVEALAEKAALEGTRDAIRLAAYTGLRRGELLALTPDAWRDGALWLATSKSGRPRRVPVPPHVHDICDRLPLRTTVKLLASDFRKARVLAGLPQVHFHDLRHTYASWLVQSGAGLLVVKNLLGHSTMQMTSRYAHLEDKQMNKAVSRLKSRDAPVTRGRQKPAAKTTKAR
jgi:integrase